jgi:hypothetical protein
MLVIGEVYTILVIVVVGKVEGRTMVGHCVWIYNNGGPYMVGHCVWISNNGGCA